MATLLSRAEKSYIITSLTSKPPLRHDGRGPVNYRLIGLARGDSVAPLANGSAKIRVGGTEVVAAVRLEVEDIDLELDEGRMRCNVTCSPAAYPHLSANQQDDIQKDLTSLLQSTFSPTKSHDSNGDSFTSVMSKSLTILPGRKAWTMYLDAVVLSDAGNVHDVLFLACRAAICDTRVPRTRAVEYAQPSKGSSTRRAGETGGEMDVEEEADIWKTAVQSKRAARAADFELEDTADEGGWLEGRERCPVAVTLNVLPTMHILDATHAEEQAVPLKLVLIYSFATISTQKEGEFMGMRLLGPGQVPMAYLSGLIQEGETYAKQLVSALNVQMEIK